MCFITTSYTRNERLFLTGTSSSIEVKITISPEYLAICFFLISNVNFIKSAEGRNPKKIYIQKNSTKYTKDTYAKILLLLVSHSGNEPSSTHVA
jgi:hypothetical protein